MALGSTLALLPEALQRNSPSRALHVCSDLQGVFWQVMLFWTKQVQRVTHVFSRYQLSPNCGAWGLAQPSEMWKLEVGECPPTL